MALKLRVREKIMNEVIRHKGPVSRKKRNGESGAVEWRVLVVDKLAMRILSACCKMHDISYEGITLVEDIHKNREALKNMNAVYFISPSEESVLALIKDFEHPNSRLYRCANVFFTKAIPDDIFQMFKNTNVVNYMKACSEVNIAFIPYEEQVFSLGSADAFQCIYSPSLSPSRHGNMDQIAEQVATLCATLGEYPAVRYRSDWYNNVQLAQLIQQKLDAYKADEPTMGEGPEKAYSQLIILDRGFDCLTPLLHDLTLQAMAYDLLPIVNDVYKFVPGLNVNYKEVLLDENDELWVELRHQHISVVCKQIHDRLSSYKRMNQGNKQSIRDLSQRIKKMPQYQKELSELSTYLQLAEDCMKAYDEYVYKLCLVEQDLAIGSDAKGQTIKNYMPNIVTILSDASISNYDKVRIICLYVIRNRISENDLIELFTKAQIGPKEQDMVRNLSFMGINIGSDGNLKKTCTVPRRKRITEHTYTMSRWTPVIKDIMEDCIEDKLDARNFPYLVARSPSTAYNELASSARYRNLHKNKTQKTAIKNVPLVIVFIVGGVTISEMRCAYEVTATTRKWETIIGSSHIITPQIFLNDLGSLRAKQFDD